MERLTVLKIDSLQHCALHYGGSLTPFVPMHAHADIDYPYSYPSSLNFFQAPFSSMCSTLGLLVVRHRTANLQAAQVHTSLH